MFVVSPSRYIVIVVLWCVYYTNIIHITDLQRFINYLYLRIYFYNSLIFRHLIYVKT